MVGQAAHLDKAHFKECLLEMLSDMFGPNSVSPLIRGDKMTVTIDDHTAFIDLNSLVCVPSKTVHIYYILLWEMVA